jgi:phage terminase small subunit
MPALPNFRQEAFAQARAKGERLEDAYEDAGYTPARGNASRLAARPEVADRIAEIRAERGKPKILDHDTAIDLLMRTHLDLRDSADHRVLKEGRLCLAEAVRLTNEKKKERDLERAKLYEELEKPNHSNI